jgi:hypothetical protein
MTLTSFQTGTYLFSTLLLTRTSIERDVELYWIVKLETFGRAEIPSSSYQVTLY